ncbi:DnaJ family domain-containing protein [Gracilibacillus sp. YIM 98692]|uniref:DnaJ family domain-containing protein n=1 Tax=Gracilibacillus sp. YIM 98692 TaxID=2663532 RepID=UPI001F09889C|nr:DnaJ family domain-containing protein [Gracilibacillus sp. YIM 98692]
MITLDLFTQLAEEKIKKAIEDGDFDHLEGNGKPQKLEDLSRVPEDMRMSYHMMKNSGYLPEEVKLNKQMINIKDMIRACESDEKKQSLEKRLTEKELELKMVLEKRKIKNTNAYRKYSHKIHRLF